MRIDQYLDTARARRNLPSDNRLAAALGIKSPSVNAWRLKKSWPADDTMRRLAELAGIPAEQALLDLNTWRAQSPEVAAIYSRIADQIKAVAGGSTVTAFLLAAIFTAAAPGAGTKAAQITSDFPVLYIMRFVRRWWRERGRALPAAA